MADDPPPRSRVAREAAERALVRIVHHYGARPGFVLLGGLVPELLCAGSEFRRQPAASRPVTRPAVDRHRKKCQFCVVSSHGIEAGSQAPGRKHPVEPAEDLIRVGERPWRLFPAPPFLLRKPRTRLCHPVCARGLAILNPVRSRRRPRGPGSTVAPGNGSPLARTREYLPPGPITEPSTPRHRHHRATHLLKRKTDRRTGLARRDRGL